MKNLQTCVNEVSRKLSGEAFFINEIVTLEGLPSKGSGVQTLKVASGSHTRCTTLAGNRKSTGHSARSLNRYKTLKLYNLFCKPVGSKMAGKE